MVIFLGGLNVKDGATGQCIQSPDFFHGSPDFPLLGVGRSGVIMRTDCRPGVK